MRKCFMCKEKEKTKKSFKQFMNKTGQIKTLCPSCKASAKGLNLTVKERK